MVKHGVGYLLQYIMEAVPCNSWVHDHHLSPSSPTFLLHHFVHLCIWHGFYCNVFLSCFSFQSVMYNVLGGTVVLFLPYCITALPKVDVVSWSCCLYQGKMNRAMTVLATWRLLHGDSTPSDEELFSVIVLAWCIELVSYDLHCCTSTSTQVQHIAVMTWSI